MGKDPNLGSSSLVPLDAGYKLDPIPLSQAQGSVPKELPARDADTTVSWSFGPEPTATWTCGTLADNLEGVAIGSSDESTMS